MVGLTFVDPRGNERHEAYIGRIREIRSHGGRYQNIDDATDRACLLIECHDGKTREYPWDLEALAPADPGVYKLRDGASIENPDYEMHWRIKESAKH